MSAFEIPGLTYAVTTGILESISPLVAILLELALVVSTMLLVSALVIVGPRKLVDAAQNSRWRFEVLSVPLGALLAILAFRRLTQDVHFRIQHVVGIELTPVIESVEWRIFGENPVVALQSVQTPELTSFFVFIYIYGYAFLLLFPLIAYFALDDMNELTSLIVAFTANYGIGILCYLVFVAYGPRNVDPLVYENLLYDAFPQSRYLTNEVNQNVNVFPSLHTSLSATVFFLAWIARDRYPLWVPISGILAFCVILSTMYLGIHWLSDVLAGIVLAAVSVHIGANYTIHGLLRSIRLYLDSRIERGV